MTSTTDDAELPAQDHEATQGPAEEIYARMASATLDGVPLNELVGGGDPRASGGAIVEILRNFDLLRPDLPILDLGCGCGRAAVALMEALDGRCDYLGLDIVPGLISFCREEISSRYPTCSFATTDGSNPHYDRYVRDDEKVASSAPKIDLEGRFELVLAFSLFTHLRRREAYDCLRTIYRALVPGGSAVLSCLLLDHASRRQIWQRQALLFGDRSSRYKARAGTRVLVERDNVAVAFDQALFTGMICKSGFDGIRLIHFGHWRGVEGLHFQDLVVLRKGFPFPTTFDPVGYLEANPDVARSGVPPDWHYRACGQREGRGWRPPSDPEDKSRRN